MGTQRPVPTIQQGKPCGSLQGLATAVLQSRDADQVGASAATMTLAWKPAFFNALKQGLWP